MRVKDFGMLLSLEVIPVFRPAIMPAQALDKFSRPVVCDMPPMLYGEGVKL